MDAEVPDPPAEPAEPANARNGLGVFFGKATRADQRAEVAEPTDPAQAEAEVPVEPVSESAEPAVSRAGRAPGRPARRGPALTASRGVTMSKTSAAPAAPAVTATAIADRGAAALPADGQQDSRAPAGRRIVNPHLRADPRLRVWVTRALVSVVLFAGFAIALDWRYGVTSAVIYAAADTIYRSKTTAVVPSSVRVTSAQRFTRRRLRVVQPAGYLALHARKIPGTSHVIDHVVVGPAGVFTLDSQRLDRRLPLRVIGGMLYHGRTSMEERLDHAKHEAGHAASLIASELGQRVRVRPAMVMYGPNVTWVIMKVKGVDVFDGSRIVAYFRRQSKAVGQRRLTSAQIAMIFAAAARALPPLN